MTIVPTSFDEETSWAKRVVGIVLLLAVIGGGGFAAWWYFGGDDSGATPAAAQQTATVTKGRLVSSLTTTGVAASTLTSKLTFASSGQVKSVSVAVGTKVTAGQELARLDDKDVQRKLDSAASNLETAKLKLQQLQQPPTAADLASARQSVASAQQSVTNAQNQVTTAQANLDKAAAPPAAVDVATADAAVSQAEVSLSNAHNSESSAWIALINAQRVYCQSKNVALVVAPCYESDLPLSQAVIDAFTAWLRAPGDSGADLNAATSAAGSFINANTSYKNAHASIATAEQSLATAKLKRQALDDGPTASDLAQLRGAVASAQAGVAAAQAGLASAQARLDLLEAGPTATDVALQQQSVKQAQIAYDTAHDALDGIVLKAPYDGVIAALAINAGDQVSASTAAMTVTNPEGVRIDLAVSETDFNGLKAGQFGIATFDAVPGQTYLVKIIAVTTTPTVTQGVVTYPVQAQILRGKDLQDNIGQLQTVSNALASLGGGNGAAFAGRGGGQAGATGQAGQPGTPGPGGTPGQGARSGNGAPAANGTPGASGSPGSGRPAGAGGGFGQGLQDQPLPTPGMNASIILLLDVKEDVLLLPTAAVRRQGRTSFVSFLKPDGTTEQRNVVTGGTDATNTAITSGLNEGDQVVLGGTTAARTTTAVTGQQGGTFGPPGGDSGGATGGVR